MVMCGNSKATVSVTFTCTTDWSTYTDKNIIRIINILISHILSIKLSVLTAHMSTQIQYITVLTVAISNTACYAKIGVCAANVLSFVFDDHIDYTGKSSRSPYQLQYIAMVRTITKCILQEAGIETAQCTQRAF